MLKLIRFACSSLKGVVVAIVVVAVVVVVFLNLGHQSLAFRSFHGHTSHLPIRRDIFEQPGSLDITGWMDSPST